MPEWQLPLLTFAAFLTLKKELDDHENYKSGRILAKFFRYFNVLQINDKYLTALLDKVRESNRISNNKNTILSRV